MNRKRVVRWIALSLILVLVLFLPILKGTQDEGGTKAYDALVYKIVAWNRAEESGGNEPYRKTSVFWYPDSRKPLEELWKLEKAKRPQPVISDIPEDSDHSMVIDSASFDIDGDGAIENCIITYGPTSGLFTVVLTASDEKGIKYKNTFLISSGGIRFYQADGAVKLVAGYPGDPAEISSEYIYNISVKDKAILIENEKGSLPYWGGADWNWNLK